MAKLSGAQNRKRQRERAAVAADRQQANSYNWLSQDAYKGNAAAWDPKAPPFELPLYGQPVQLVVRTIEQAIRQLEQGAFYYAAYLWEQMLKDDRLAAKVEERIDRLIGAPLDIEPATTINRTSPKGITQKSPTEQTQKIADDFKDQYSRIMPPHQLTKLLRNAYSMSVGVAHVEKVRTATSTQPTIRVWNNRYLRYDWLSRQFRLVTENHGEITLLPDDPEWIVYQPFGPIGWLDAAKIRSSALPWLIRHWSRSWWARRQEVHGQPIRLGIIPSTRDPQDEKTFLAQLTRLNHEAVIRLPQGTDGNKFDVKLLEAAGTDWEGFQKLLEHCDDSLAVVWLGQAQSTKGQGGLGAKENAGESTIVPLLRKDKLVEQVLRDQLIKPWCDDNYVGDAEKLAPSLNWQIDPPEDAEKVSKSDLQLAQAVNFFKQAGAPLDVRAYLTDRLGAEYVLTEEEHAAQKEAAVDDAQAMMVATTPAPDPDDKDKDEPKDA